MQALSEKTMNFSGESPASDLEKGAVLELKKSSWLGRLRWLAIIAQISCAGFGLRFGLLQSKDLPAYGAVIVMLIAFNLVWPWIRVRLQTVHWLPLVFLEMLFDLGTLGFLLSVTGGCLNPFFALLYLHSALGPLMLKGLWSRLYLFATMTCLALVCQNTDWSQHAAHANLGLPKELKLTAEIFVSLVIWSLTQWFSSAIDQLKQTIADLQRQKQRSDHLRALGAMAASFSHEFSTPLNTAKMRLERVRRLHDQLQGNSDIEASMAALNRCESILKALFHSEQPASAARLELTDLGPFVQDICARWQESQPQIDLHVNRHADEPMMSRVPRLVLSRSLLDLLDNAAQSMDTPHDAIEIFMTRDDQKVALRIADRGRGIAPYVRDRMGEPFISTRVNGVGLGLFTASAMMEALGGQLHIDDRAGGGTVVTLLFPAF